MGDRTWIHVVMPKEVVLANIDVVCETFIPHVIDDTGTDCTLENLMEDANVEIDESAGTVTITEEESNMGGDENGMAAFVDRKMPFLAMNGAGSNFEAGDFGYVFVPKTAEASSDQIAHSYEYFTTEKWTQTELRAFAKKHESIDALMAALDKDHFYPDNIDWNEQAALYAAFVAGEQVAVAEV